MKIKYFFHIGLPVLVLLTIIFACVSTGDDSVTQALAILTGCFALHLVIWMLAAIGVVGIMQNKANDHCFWFREQPWEARFFRMTKIRKWKHLLPTYAPQYYDFATIPRVELLGIISQTEVVHEVAALLALLSLIGILWLGHAEIIATLAVIDFVINIIYVFLQRYNRMRLRRLIV